MARKMPVKAARTRNGNSSPSPPNPPPVPPKVLDEEIDGGLCDDLSTGGHFMLLEDGRRMPSAEYTRMQAEHAAHEMFERMRSASAPRPRGRAKIGQVVGIAAPTIAVIMAERPPDEWSTAPKLARLAERIAPM